jgi:hypothetical protein
MASTIQYSLIRRPALLDVVDEDWERDVLPVDGAFFNCVASAQYSCAPQYLLQVERGC